jgi:hypothetical protein
MSDQIRGTQSPDEAESADPVDSKSVDLLEDRDDGPVRRLLIRATLKHPDGTPPPPRPPPVFTMHQQERGGSSPDRGQNQNRSFRFGRDAGQTSKKSGSRDRSGQGASQNASMKNSGQGGKNRSPRSNGSGQNGAPFGNRAASSRRDKGRPR